jgi:hypothetical protein
MAEFQGLLRCLERQEESRELVKDLTKEAGQVEEKLLA